MIVKTVMRFITSQRKMSSVSFLLFARESNVVHESQQISLTFLPFLIISLITSSSQQSVPVKAFEKILKEPLEMKIKNSTSMQLFMKSKYIGQPEPKKYSSMFSHPTLRDSSLRYFPEQLQIRLKSVFYSFPLTVVVLENSLGFLPVKDS